MDIALFSLILVFFVICSGFFSASETALFSLSSIKIKSYQNSSSATRRLIAKLVSEPRDLLVTIFVLNTLVNILIQNTTSNMLGESTDWLLRIGIPFVLMLFLGEIIPKYLGLQNNVAIADLVAPLINYMQNFLKPVNALIINITTPVSRVMFFFLHQEESISKEELKHVLETSQERGVLNQDETDLIWGYIKLQDASVKQLMRPRDDIIFYDIKEPISKLIYLFVDQECSRIPVCDESIDDVLGIITARQFFLHRHEIKDAACLENHLIKPLYVPENISANSLAKQLEEQRQVIALVVDEYGSISGLVTYEDLVEEVIGDISDLRDPKSLYTRAGQNEIVASGRLELEDFNSIFHSELASDNNITIGGWLIEQLQDIPKAGTKFELHGFLFQVLAATPTRISRLYIRHLAMGDQ